MGMNIKKIGFVLLLMLVSTSAYAFNVTGYTTADLGYDIWDGVVNSFLGGPLGGTIAVAAGAYGIQNLIRSNVMGGAGPLIGGIALANADSLAGAMGALIVV